MRKWLSNIIKAVLETTFKEANIVTKADMEEVREEIINMGKNYLEHIYQAINATNANVRAIAKAMEMLNQNLVIAIQDLPPLH